MRQDIIKIQNRHESTIVHSRYYCEAVKIASIRFTKRGVVLKMELLDTKYHCHNNEEVYLSNDGFQSDCVAATLSKFDEEVGSLEFRVGHTSQRDNLRENDKLSIIKPSGMPSVYESVIVCLKRKSMDNIPFREILGKNFIYIYNKIVIIKFKLFKVDNKNHADINNCMPQYLYHRHLDIRYKNK